MFIIIWQYTVNPICRELFIEHYKADGVWAAFFQQSRQYFGTDFFEVSNNLFITIDKWSSEAEYESFLKTHQQAYNQIDTLCEGFTAHEELVSKNYVMV
jgi:hypothetical protein